MTIRPSTTNSQGRTSWLTTALALAIAATLLTTACDIDGHRDTVAFENGSVLDLNSDDFERITASLDQAPPPDASNEQKRTIVTVAADEPIDRLIVEASASIDKFWHDAFTRRGWTYVGPREVVFSERRIDNAYFTSLSNTIVYDRLFLAEICRTRGDFAVVTLLAHEWGHQIQWQRGETGGGLFVELGADSLAGAYARYAKETGLLEFGDVFEALDTLFDAGDPSYVPFFDDDAHGSSSARIQAFQIGYRQGADSCCDEL